MSLPARIVTLLVAFAAVVAGAVSSSFTTSAQPAVVNFTPEAPAALSTWSCRRTRRTRCRRRPDWVSYFVQDPKTHAWVHTTLVPGAEGHPGEHDDPGLRRLHAAAQQLLEQDPGHRSATRSLCSSSRPSASRSARPGRSRPSTPGKRAASGTRSRSPACTCSSRSPRPTPRCSTAAACGVVALHLRPALDGEVQLHDAEQHRHVPLAVPGPVRRRLPGRQRRPDADASVS